MAEPDVLFGVGPEDYRQAEWLGLVLDHAWRYDHTAKAWHHWNSIRWAKDDTDAVRKRVADLAAKKLGDLTIQENERKALIKLLSIPAIDRALEALASFPDYGTNGEDWDQDPFLLGCDNGIVDLRTNMLIEHPEPTSLVTRTTHATFTPVTTPSEFADRAPLFMGFLTDIMSGDIEMVSFLLLWFGASLFGFSPEQRFLLMTGIGRNGKGALKHSVMKAVGEYGSQPDGNVYMRSKMGGARSDGARADLMDLKGRRITFFSEPEGNRFNEELLKAHTGGDMITARALYSNRVISWEPTHSITFLVNNAPEVEDLGPSMAARVMVADFRERYDGDKEDKQLYRKLEAERNGIIAILAWAASAWYESWDSTGQGITLPKRVVEQSKAFMERNDVVAAFLDDAMALERDVMTKAGRVYDAYLQWHARSERTDEAISNVRFAAAMERKGFRKQKRETGMHYLGLRILNAVEVAEGEDD
jgi:putative DNA primase/helicase